MTPSPLFRPWDGCDVPAEETKPELPRPTVPDSPASDSPASITLPGSPASLPASPVNLPASPASLPSSPVSLSTSSASLPASPASLPASPASLPASPASLPASPASLSASPVGLLGTTGPVGWRLCGPPSGADLPALLWPPALTSGRDPWPALTSGRDPWSAAALAEESRRRADVSRRRMKKFGCPKCPMMFSNRGQLAGHYRKHTGETRTGTGSGRLVWGRECLGGREQVTPVLSRG